MLNYLRIIFAGATEFAAQHLAMLLTVSNRYQVVGILTHPDKPVGRGQKIIQNPVKTLAKQANIIIFQPITLKTTDAQYWIEKQNADIMIVVSYGLIFPEEILNIFPMGCLNVHGSLLPRWRGAAPIQRSIYAGDKETGITIIQMDSGIDTGDILYKISCPIKVYDTSAILYKKLAKFGSIALLHTLNLISLGQIKREKQNNIFATYAKKLNKNEALIQWNFSAEQIERCIRAFNPWPVSYFVLENQRIKVWHAEIINCEITLSPGTIFSANKDGIKVVTGKGVLNILKIQPANKKIMLVGDFLNSHPKWFIPGRIIS